MTEHDNIININSLAIGYNPGTKREKILIHGLDLSIMKGEMVALIGPNGIGKSTLLRTIAGLQSGIRGEISLWNRNQEDYSRNEMARKLSYVFPGFTGAYNMSVFELVALGRFPHTNWLGRLTGHDRAIIEESIGSVGLSGHSGSNIGELSDGERQRAMIARALAQDTDLILLDEPTAFLDLPNRHELVSLLRKLSVGRGKSVVFSTHDIHIAIREADKVWLASGESVKEGSPEDLAINGWFDKLFEDSDLRFIPDEGIFIYPVKTRMTIRLDGTDLLKYWTERALNRLGIRAREGAVSPSISVVSEKGSNTWIYESSADKKIFRDIYSLMLYLRMVLQE